MGEESGRRDDKMGATLAERGVRFAVYAGNATQVDVVLFDQFGQSELGSYPLSRGADGVWAATVIEAGVGSVYGYRAQGPYDPSVGHRYQANKLLLDPYAKQIVGQFNWSDLHLDTGPEGSDNAAHMVKAQVVVDDDFDWGSDQAPGVPTTDTVLYEVHVKGFTQLNDNVPENLRGRYAGLASPAAIAHYRSLGITSINLLPVHYHLDEAHLAQRGKVNYWGYNTLGFFAPNPRYADRDPRTEFRQMVKDLHAAGIEVILDVVYNHTAEGNENGPTLSWRGLDNAAYYRLPATDKALYENHSGCGNTVNMSHPASLKMVLDSLRYWVTEMHVDGFRFDLAAILGRTDEGFSVKAPFFQALKDDPVLMQVKLIAEPWDIGPGGYQFGHFPDPWSEWNDQFRRRVRSYWMQQGSRADLASSIGGSGDTFSGAGRLPQASINYVCAHDGFTLHDLVSYDHKHNEANGEENRDGSDDNQSWNCGHEGPSDLLGVVALRARLKKAILSTLLLSRGVPMLMAGDELGRTQSGNNNAYCVDGPLTWLHWDGIDQSLMHFVSGLLALRRRYEQLRSSTWLGQTDTDHNQDVHWLEPDGHDIEMENWHREASNAVAVLLNGQRRLLILFNGSAADQTFELPIGRWQMEMDSALREPFSLADQMAVCEDAFLMKARAVTVFGEVP
ncbi:MAG: glycogen debranching protein GlgX [Burkholderiaceae bacterium]